MSSSELSTDCPICCDTLTDADRRYVLHCPTSTCHFNYCANCVKSLERSAADGYQEASDGSQQVKVHLQCPQCRGPYRSSKYTSQHIVDSVLLLRKAHSMTETLQQKDSEMTATALKSRHSFLRTTSVQDLHDAFERVSLYHAEIGIDDPVQPLDWEVWNQHLPAHQPVSSKAASSSSSSSTPWVDPSLFLGLEECMSRDEQEFVTSLLTKGEPELVFQAALILHGVLNLVISGSAARAASHVFCIPGLDMHQVRKRWPLPARMPRCISLPVYDPQAKQKSLKFIKNTLILAGVRGPAGKVGLRAKDVVTHINGEPVEDVEVFCETMRRLFLEDPEGSVLIVVNADEDTALALKERAQKMIHTRDQIRKKQQQQQRV